ncbi:substrate-binding domain-containing protein [Nakamurella leprariae]|uniref:Substrate-binding domain-containing protein n=1 Tax=Nakamurella leprariae TaxID=2803911 RepID=A0A938YK10_9ACTN|nr:substrate-binding domain-containing protein [Nakamurella leprariae]MBM9469205.1 substrate-binding domain-containing protein [Nakamurella leprariae]
MARHAGEGRRGIARWVWVTVAVAVVAALAVVGYVAIVGQDDPDPATVCTQQAELAVTATPAQAAALTAAAAAFDATRPVARSACVSSTVTAAATPEDAGELGTLQPPPAVLVVDSPADLAALEEHDSAVTAGRDDDPEASSPVVLAVRPDDADRVADALAGGGWADLVQLVGDGTTAGPLALALPDPAGNRASAYLVESVVLAAQDGTTATADGSPEAVDESAVTGALPLLDRLAAATAASRGPDAAGTTAEALTGLATAGDADPAGPVPVVPVVETDLVAWNSTADEPLAAVRPAGPAVGDTVLVVQLSADWVDATAREAAAQFAAFLRSAPGRQVLADAGLQVPDTTATVSWPALLGPVGGAAAVPAATGAARTAALEPFAG